MFNSIFDFSKNNLIRVNFSMHYIILLINYIIIIIDEILHEHTENRTRHVINKIYLFYH